MQSSETSDQGSVAPWSPGRSRAFTLIEILVAVAIIALLVAILMPIIRQSKGAARAAVCYGNLHAIYQGTLSYAFDFDRKLPDKTTTGDYQYRMAPGLITPNNAGALPEVYGWAAILDKHGSLSGNSDVWVCPASEDWMHPFGNTYQFTMVSFLPTHTVERLQTRMGRSMHLLWDNYNLLPGLSGFRGPFPGYTIPSAVWKFPHTMSSNSSKGSAVLLIGGDVQIRSAME